jgi:hypothetical protein
MDVLDRKTDTEIIRTMLAEMAKASNELRCARGDLEKAHNRLNFLLVLANKMIERQEI